jgi:hypothetical protein
MPFDDPGGRTPLTEDEVIQRRRLVAAAYRGTEKKHFYTITERLEDMPDPVRRAYPTTGTLLQPAVDALNAAGILTPSTIGGLEDNLAIDPHELHTIACHCHGHTMETHRIANLFEPNIPLGRS